MFCWTSDLPQYDCRQTTASRIQLNCTVGLQSATIVEGHVHETTNGNHACYVLITICLSLWLACFLSVLYVR